MANMTPEQMLAKKDERRKRQIPKARSYTLRSDAKDKVGVPVSVKYSQDVIHFTMTLPASKQKVMCKFEFGQDSIERTVRMAHGFEPFVSSMLYARKRTANAVARNKKGQPIVSQVAVPSTFLTRTVEDGKKLTSRSVCKEPDP